MSQHQEIELELTYLARAIPENTLTSTRTSLVDIYFPASVMHPKTRIRNKGGNYTFTKKTMIDPNDAGNQREENIELSRDEFEALAQGNGKELVKERYFVPYGELTAEVDIFKGALAGLVVIEFEFTSEEAKANFTQPDFCLADVTQEDFIAGGMLAGKSYADIQSDLDRFNYQPLHLP